MPNRVMHTMMAEFDSEDDALEALHDLERLPLEGHLRCTVHHRDEHLELVRAEDHLLRRLGMCMVLGAPIGAVAGIAVMALWARSNASVSTGLILGVGFGAGTIFGLLVGGIVGIAWGSREMEEAGRWERMHLADHEVVIALIDDETLDVEVPDLDDATPVTVPEEIRKIFAQHHGHTAMASSA